MSDFDLEAVKKDHVDECHICNPGELYPNDCDLAATIAELEFRDHQLDGAETECREAWTEAKRLKGELEGAYHIISKNPLYEDWLAARRAE